MAEQYQIGGGSWWEAPRTRFDSRTSPSSSAALSSVGGSFGWPPTEMAELNFKARSNSNKDSVSVSVPVSVSSSDSMLFQDPNLHLMGLGLSSHQAMDNWNQTTTSLRSNEKSETSFRPALAEDLSAGANFQQQIGIESSQDQWTQKMYSVNSSPNNYYKQFGSNISSNFQVDPTAFGRPSSAISSDHNQLQRPNFENVPCSSSYGLNYSGEIPHLSQSKFPQFLRNSAPRRQPNSQLQFSYEAPVWNPASAAITDVRSSFFPPPLDEKPKNKSEVRDLGTVTKKSSSEPSNKRSRNEPLPPFKVRREKMGDRITALQQLVSPFGKTDTASVLTEAIEYIKFLHEQVHVLSNPYKKSGASMQFQQVSFDKSKDKEGSKQDLRSLGLCLVPVSSTFPVTHETTVDFWTPTFGGTFR